MILVKNDKNKNSVFRENRGAQTNFIVQVQF